MEINILVEFWNIIKYNDWIIFQSLDRIYFYNTIDETFNSFSSDVAISKIFVVAKLQNYSRRQMI